MHEKSDSIRSRQFIHSSYCTWKMSKETSSRKCRYLFALSLITTWVLILANIDFFFSLPTPTDAIKPTHNSWNQPVNLFRSIDLLILSLLGDLAKPCFIIHWYISWCLTLELMDESDLSLVIPSDDHCISARCNQYTHEQALKRQDRDARTWCSAYTVCKEMRDVNKYQIVGITSCKQHSIIQIQIFF